MVRTAMLRFATTIVLTLSVAYVSYIFVGVLREKVRSGCTFSPAMEPKFTVVPMATGDVGSGRYKLYLFHQGHGEVDFNLLRGVPVLFIPGSAGSYRQVRWLAAESERAYKAGPQEQTFYQEASLTPEEGGLDIDIPGFQLPNQYTRRLDWFTVDLDDELSAMDGRVLEDHTKYAVVAIHRILDLYKKSRSVIVVGHSMGGFVARSAAIHPDLRKYAVETILTFASPHQAPPLPLQPSLGHYFARVNEEWREGYQDKISRTGYILSPPLLSHVVTISISGGHHDYQIRTMLASLDGIVPLGYGFMISSTSIKNVWLSLDHQSILWCNELVVQVSHTLLSMVDPKTGEPFPDSLKRSVTFARMLRSGVPRPQHPIKDAKKVAGSLVHVSSSCPSNWTNDGLETDLHIGTSMVTVSAMDGRRRLLDIKHMGSNGKGYFVLVTNLAPCSGIRIHLLAENERAVDVTSKIMHISSGLASMQTDQAPPSAVFRLGPEDMHGFKLLAISIAPSPTISETPPSAISMAVGQFFNPDEGNIFSPQMLLVAAFFQKGIYMKEDHHIAFDISLPASIGLLPVTVSLTTVGCGTKTSELCKMRCFPPVALVWDTTSGLNVFTSFSETLIVESLPRVWTSTPGSEKTTVMLLADPHCSYKSSVAISFTAVASRFLLLYGTQIAGFSVAVVFFALMRQADAWDRGMPIPSLLVAVESNLRTLSLLLLTAFMPIPLSLLLSLVMSYPLPPFASFTAITIMGYFFAIGPVVLLDLVLVSPLLFHVAAYIHIFMKSREGSEGMFCFASMQWLISPLRVVRSYQPLITTMVAAIVVCVHPTLGLVIVLVSHGFRCHSALCSSLRGSSDAQGGVLDLESNAPTNPNSPRTFSERQSGVFNYYRGLLILHLIAALMFAPSLVAWFQRLKTAGHSFPGFLDAVLCIGVILHGICSSKPEPLSLFPFTGWKLRWSYIYLLAGYFSYLCGLAFAPYRVFYAMAPIGFISSALRLISYRTEDSTMGRSHTE